MYVPNMLLFPFAQELHKSINEGLQPIWRLQLLIMAYGCNNNFISWEGANYTPGGSNCIQHKGINGFNLQASTLMDRVRVQRGLLI